MAKNLFPHVDKGAQHECDIATYKRMLPTSVFNKNFGHLGECSSADPNTKRYQDLEIQQGPDALDRYESTQASVQGSRAGQQTYRSCNKHQSFFAEIGDKMEDAESLIGTEAKYPKEKKRRSERETYRKSLGDAAWNRFVINRMFDQGKVRENDALAPLELVGQEETPTLAPRVKTKLVQQQPTEAVRPEDTREEPISVLPSEETMQEAIEIPKPKKFKPTTESKPRLFD